MLNEEKKSIEATSKDTAGKVESFMTNPNVNIFAATNFRNQFQKFGIKLDDRRRHMYVIGKTGMGKTTMLENLVLNDIYAGHGIGIVDPHGDFAEKIIDYIPPHRINDVVYFNPSDLEFPIGFNILEMVNPDHKHLVASGLMGVFKKIWVDMWSSRMEYILNNTILALLDFPNTTLLGINRLLSDKAYRKRVVACVKDPVVKAFWETEFASYNDRYAQEAVAPIQNKIGQFLSASVIRNIVAQVKSKIDVRDIMDNKKIFIMNLSKGRIGEDNSALIGGMLISKIQLTAMERVDMPETERSDFFLYVDEFQNFATPSFANILSEARKYHLGLILAHQYMEQLDETVREAVLGNVGTTATFRVGSTDSEILAKEFAPVFIEEDLINLPKFNIYLKLMIDGVSSKPFSANTLPPIGHPTGTTAKVIKVSRERYAIPRGQIEERIMKWSGMDEDENNQKLNKSKSQENKNNDKKVSEYNLRMDNKKNNSKNASNPIKKTPTQNNNDFKKPISISLVNTKQKGLSLNTLTPDIIKENKVKKEITNNTTPTENIKINKAPIKTEQREKTTLSDLIPSKKESKNKITKISEKEPENTLMPGFVSQNESKKKLLDKINLKVIKPDEVIKVKNQDDDNDEYRKNR